MNTNYWCEEEIEDLVHEVAKTNIEEEVERLFDVILTPREINDMAKRLRICKMLEEGKTYTEIQMALHVSPTIIGRVSHKIGYGFRRSYAEVVGSSKAKPKKPYKKIRRYKGAVPIHRIFG